MIRANSSHNPLTTTDKPDPPGKPEVADSDKDHITIKWDPPKKDGGSPVLGYNVERRDPKTGTWKKINSDPVKVSPKNNFKKTS